MTHCCSQCNFSSKFESALAMHRQLHHDATPNVEDFMDLTAKKGKTQEKSKTLPAVHPFKPRINLLDDYCGTKSIKNSMLPSRSSSATRLFGKLRAKICKSKTLFVHHEENDFARNFNDSVTSECTSKALKEDSGLYRSSATTCLDDNQKETYGCHLCPFDAERITILDRHLLTDHKIGLDNLLKLVMVKTQSGLCEEPGPSVYGIRQPYYKPPDDLIEEGEFIIETVTPKIKILKHAATNTDIQWSDIPNLKDNCRMITKELDKLIKFPIERFEKDKLLDKMQTLNECMCKFVDSSNTLKKVLTREFDSVKDKDMSEEEPLFDLGLGDSRETPREWERAHSEKIERRSKHGAERGDKSKLSAESYYF